MKNKQERKKTIAEKKKTKAIIFRRVYDYLLKHPCVDCGETDPIVLEFDHKDPKTKSFNVSTYINKNPEWSEVEKEMAKCEIRCANCHKRKTAGEQKWRSWRIVNGEKI